MHLLPRMNVMLNFICMAPVDPPGTRRKRQNAKWEIHDHSDIRTHSPEIWSLMLYQLSCIILLKSIENGLNIIVSSMTTHQI